MTQPPSVRFTAGVPVFFSSVRLEDKKPGTPATKAKKEVEVQEALATWQQVLETVKQCEDEQRSCDCSADQNAGSLCTRLPITKSALPPAMHCHFFYQEQSEATCKLKGDYASVISGCRTVPQT